MVFDIFCGAGGMSEGFIQAGFDVRFATDINETAKLTYMNRHCQLGYETEFACLDIKEVAQKRFLNKFLGGVTIDVVCGGPPCQGFSLAGKRDKNDPRNKLFKSYINVIKNVKPKYFVMENVEGILSMKFDEFIGVKKKVYINKKVSDILIDEFWQIGYHVEYRVLQASDYGVPQNRKRVFFIGHAIKRFRGEKYKSLVTPPRFPEKLSSEPITIKEAIDDLAFLDAGHRSTRYINMTQLSKYQASSIEGRTPTRDQKSLKSLQVHNHEAAQHSKKVVDRFALMNQGDNVGNLKRRLNGSEWKVYETRKTRCKRAIEDKPSPTILTLPDDLIHYEKNRIMTVREFARIQSFDDSFEFLGKRTTGGDRRKLELPQYTQVGNAVPPLLAKAVAVEIMKALNSKKTDV